MKRTAEISILGYVYGTTGNQAEAQAILKDLLEASKEQNIPSIAFAHIYTGLNDHENAISWPEK